MLVSSMTTTPNPPRNCVVSGDGTVPTMPMRREVLKKRRAVGLRVDFEHHTEGGGHPVDGLKFYLQSARVIDEGGSTRPNSRMILGLALVPKKGAGGEAGIAVAKLLELKKRAPGMLGARYDGALRGKHLDELMKAGLAVVNPPHEQTARREHFDDITCTHVDTSTGAFCDKVTSLYKQNGALGVLEVLADEEVTVLFHALPSRIIPRGAAPRARWYVELTLPCGHTHLERLTSSSTDDRNGFNRAEHLRMHPPGSRVYDQTYAWRNDAESSHSQLDDWLPQTHGRADRRAPSPRHVELRSHAQRRRGLVPPPPRRGPGPRSSGLNPEPHTSGPSPLEGLLARPGAASRYA